MSEKSEILPVLVADPSSHMATLVAIMLRGLGYRTIDAAVDLGQIAAHLARQPYALVLLDEQLGGDAGYAMIRALRQSAHAPNRITPVFMMAAAPDARMIAAARDAGVTEFLRKPFSADHIRLRLESLRQAPRSFVEAGGYVGPDRRRRAVPGATDRRTADK